MAAEPPLLLASCSASSTLHGDEDTYGALHVLDGREDTCWNSDGGSSQELVLTLARASAVRALELVFQGGFAGQDMRVEGAPAPGAGGVGGGAAGGGADGDGAAAGGGGGSGSGEGAAEAATWVELGRFQPLDGNEPQRFALAPCAGAVQRVRLRFTGSTDFYGRVVIYAARLY